MKLIITSLAIFFSAYLNAQTAKYKLDTNEVDFGDIPCGEIVSKKIKITNTSDKEIYPGDLLFTIKYPGFNGVILPNTIKPGLSDYIIILCRNRSSNPSNAKEFEAYMINERDGVTVKLKGFRQCG